MMNYVGEVQSDESGYVNHAVNMRIRPVFPGCGLLEDQTSTRARAEAVQISPTYFTLFLMLAQSPPYLSR